MVNKSLLLAISLWSVMESMGVDILLVGARGQIGTCLRGQARAYGLSCIALSHAELDICDDAKLSACVSINKPKCIINAAAYTQVDKAESDTVAAYAANVQGVMNLAKCAQDVNAILLHISTDYVFDGTKVGSYLELEKPNPLSVYGCSKLAGELAIIDHCQRYLILRTCWVFSEYGNNFVKTMLNLAIKQRTLNVVVDQVGGPTYAGDIAVTLLLMMQQALNPHFSEWGIYHFSGDPYLSRYEFALEIFRNAKHQGLLKKIPTVHSISAADLPISAARPNNSCLDVTKIKNIFGVEASNWLNALNNLASYIS